MKNNSFNLLIIFLFCFASACGAYQSRGANDNETLHFNIAKEAYSRIFVTGDRINSIKGQSSLYEIKEFKGESEEGIIFIRPRAYVPFSVFITTELGHHYTLQLTTKSIAAENIEIKPLSPIEVKARRWEQNAPYTETLVALLRAMVNGASPEGYAVMSLNKTKPEAISCGVDMRLLKIYRGSALTGEVWQITNRSHEIVRLFPKYFYKKSVRGISFAREVVRPKEHTLLYRIISL